MAFGSDLFPGSEPYYKYFSGGKLSGGDHIESVLTQDCPKNQGNELIEINLEDKGEEA